MILTDRQRYAIHTAAKAWPLAVKRFGFCAELAVRMTVMDALDGFDAARARAADARLGRHEW